MSDISDLVGIFPVALRWNAELGVLGYSVFDEATGERTIKEIELGTPASKFVADMATRERGYGKVKVGLYDMRLTAVGSPPPPYPDDPEFKPAIGMWLWNPVIGEVRLETNAALFMRAVSGLWDRCRNFQESAQGLLPVVEFVDRRERPIAALGKIFFEPVLNICAWTERDRVPSFAARPVTVRPPLAVDSQIPFAMLADRAEHPEPSQKKAVERKAAPKRPSLGELIDDTLPDDRLDDLWQP